MPTTTTTYSFNKPVVGADEDDWGGYLNGNWDKVDDLFDGTVPVTGIDINSGTLDGVTIGGTTAGAGTFTNLTATGTTTLAGASTSADITFGDNDKAIFGASSDLSIYHDGSKSLIEETGTGSLTVRGTHITFQNGVATSTYANFVEGAEVSLRYNNATKLATTSTGIDVTGTVTADGLTVDGEATFGTATGVFPDEAILVRGNNGTSGYINGLGVGSSNAQFRIFADDTNNTAGSIKFDIRNRDKVLIEDNGAISFYEDTGTTAKFFWDASAESLGIGTTSPAIAAGGGNPELTISGTVSYFNLQGNRTAGAGNTTGQITSFNNSTAISRLATVLDSGTTDGAMLFSTASSGSLAERMRIDSSGNVGIGTSSPIESLHVSGKLLLNNGTNSYFDAAGSNGLVITNPDAVRFEIGSERMRINSSGNLSVGTTTNYTKLTVSNGPSTRSGITISDTNTASLMMFAGNSDNAVIGTDVNSLVIRRGMTVGTDNGTETARFDSSGNLLVGMTSSGYLAADDGIQIKPDGNIRIGGSGTAGRNVMSFVNNTSGTPAEVGTITTSGSSTSYNTSSDHRLKENVVNLTGATTRLKQLEPKRFNFIADAETTVDGFLAHEVQAVVPEAITGTHNEVDADGNPVYQGIDQSKLVPLLVATIKELEARITALENA